MWVAIAVLLAVGFLGIYAIQSYRYWTSWQNADSLAVRTDTLKVILSKDEPSLDEFASRLDNGQRTLEQLRHEFDHESVDSLISTLSTVASSAGVGLASMTVSNPAPEEIDGISYQIQPIVVSALGSPRQIFSFLESLIQVAPSAMVSSIQLSGLESSSVAKLSIHFYLSPQPASDGELEDEAK